MDKVVLEARGLRRAYRQGAAELEVLHGLDLEVRAGEFLVILGPSGSGKSTLLHLLGLMDRPTAGEVRLFGEATGSLGEAPRARLRNRGVGFVFQFDSLLPEFTVLENVLMPGRIAGRTGPEEAGRALELLDRLGLKGLDGRFPVELSGGERQRAAIARALAAHPAALLADEPTGNLDSRNGELVFSKLKDLASSLGVAVVMVTHNEQAARFASRTVHLIDGRIHGESKG